MFEFMCFLCWTQAILSLDVTKKMAVKSPNRQKVGHTGYANRLAIVGAIFHQHPIE